MRRGNAGQDAARGRRDVAGPDGGHAADIERTHQHQRERSELALEQRQHPLVARNRRGNVLRRSGVHAEEAAGHIHRIEQPPAHRHVNAVIVEGRKIDRGERAVFESLRPGLIGQQLLERIAPALRLQQTLRRLRRIRSPSRRRGLDDGGRGGRESVAHPRAMPG